MALCSFGVLCVMSCSSATQKITSSKVRSHTQRPCISKDEMNHPSFSQLRPPLDCMRAFSHSQSWIVTQSARTGFALPVDVAGNSSSTTWWVLTTTSGSSAVKCLLDAQLVATTDMSTQTPIATRETWPGILHKSVKSTSHLTTSIRYWVCLLDG